MALMGYVEQDMVMEMKSLKKMQRIMTFFSLKPEGRPDLMCLLTSNFQRGKKSLQKQ
jgi:hypothetical protein